MLIVFLFDGELIRERGGGLLLIDPAVMGCS